MVAVLGTQADLWASLFQQGRACNFPCQCLKLEKQRPHPPCCSACCVLQDVRDSNLLLSVVVHWLEPAKLELRT